MVKISAKFTKQSTCLSRGRTRMKQNLRTMIKYTDSNNDNNVTASYIK